MREQRTQLNQARGGAKISNFDENKGRQPMTYNDRMFANQKDLNEKLNDAQPRKFSNVNKSRSGSKYNKSDKQSVDDLKSKNGSQVSKRSKLSDSEQKALQEFLLQS